MFVTNWISTTKIQKISEITNFFRHYFLSRTEVSIATRASIIKEMGAKFNRYYLFIANYNSSQPSIDGRGKCNIWQYSETGHLHGIGERVDLSRFMNGTTIKDLML